MKTLDQSVTVNQLGEPVIKVSKDNRIEVDFEWLLKYGGYPATSVLAPALEISGIHYQFSHQSGKSKIVRSLLRGLTNYVKQYGEMSVRTFAESQYFRTSKSSAQAA